MIRAIKEVYKKVYKFASVNLLTIFVGNAFLALLPLLQTIICAKLIDILIIRNTENFKYECILFTALFFSIRIISVALKELLKYLRDGLKCSIKSGLLNIIVEKLSLVKYEDIEKKDSQELLLRIIEGSEDKYITLLENTMTLGREVFSVIYIAILIFTKNIISGVLLLLLDIPIIIFAYKNGNTTYNANVEATKHRMLYKYIESLFIERSAAYERTLFNAGIFWNDKWKNEYDASRKKEMTGFMRYFIKIRLGVMVEILCVVLVFSFLLIPLSSGVISSGEYIAIAGNILFLFQYQTNAFPFCFSELIKSVRYEKELEELLSFDELSLKDNYAANDQTHPKIQFRNVSFQYPGTEKSILNNVSFILEPGKRYAFVGANGAGKTTITKLLLGLYSNYKGYISINDIDISKLSCNEICSYFSVVFQDFSKYALSLNDNIAVGRKIMADTIDNSKSQVGLLTHKELKDDLILGKTGDSESDLSLGQWQKIAIARAIVSDSPIVILDEPTSALDPNMEYDFFMDIKHLISGKTGVLISHRLACVKDVDKIFVIDNGQIVEEGSHEELMNQDKLYRKMYDEQRHWYDT